MIAVHLCGVLLAVCLTVGSQWSDTDQLTTTFLGCCHVTRLSTPHPHTSHCLLALKGTWPGLYYAVSYLAPEGTAAGAVLTQLLALHPGTLAGATIPQTHPVEGLHQPQPPQQQHQGANRRIVRIALSFNVN